jgi:hypothetical protein
MSDKKPSEMTREEIELELLVMLTTCTWHDLTTESPDPAAVRCLGTLVPGKRDVLYLLTEYADEGRKYALVACPKDRKEYKTITDEQFKLEWLRENLQVA